MDLLIDIF